MSSAAPSSWPWPRSASAARSSTTATRSRRTSLSRTAPWPRSPARDRRQRLRHPGRLMVGGQSALEIALAVALVATSFGALWGAVSGFMGGIIDAVMMRVVDVVIAVPAIFLLIYLASVFRPSVPLLILVLSLLSWLGPARLVRRRDPVAAHEGVRRRRALRAAGAGRASSGATSSRTPSGRSRSTPPSRWPTPSSSSPP